MKRRTKERKGEVKINKLKQETKENRKKIKKKRMT